MSVLISMQLFPIDVKYAEIQLKNGMSACVLIENEEQEKKFEGKVKELHTQWQMPGWKEHNAVIRDSMIWDQYKGERTPDIQTYRGLCLERFLKAWDVTDAEGKAVPCSPQTIAQLDYKIAGALIDLFMTRTIPTEVELKN